LSVQIRRELTFSLAHLGNMTILRSIGCWVYRYVYRLTSYSSWKNAALPGDVFVKNTEIPLEGRSLPATIFVPNVEEGTDQKLRPLIVHFHGGGMCMGNSATTHYYSNVVFASLLKCTIVSVDYRLAPKHSFPSGPEDAIAATKWIAENASNFPSHNGSIVVMGDSAGATLALLSCCEEATATTTTTIAGAILFYPLLESPEAGFPSWQEMAKGHALTADVQNFLWWSYLGVTPKEFEAAHKSSKFDEASPEKELLLALAFPLRIPESVLKAKMPPTFLVTAEYDILKDEGKALGDKMKKAGAPVEHKHYIAEHGFMCTDGKKEQFEECLRDLESWMAKL
jgi:acetyl esterase